MNDIAVGPVAKGERIEVLDVLRGVAVCGILLMNIPLMGLFFDWPNPPLPAKADADWIAYLIQSVGFEGSMRGLFTLLFGAGMLIMLRQADGPAGQRSTQAYVTRCFALLLLGVANAALLFWPGEILFNYGLAGLVLLLFRKAEPRLLLTAAAALLIASTMAFTVQSFGDARTLRTGEAAVAAKAAGKTLTKAQTEAIEARARLVERRHPKPETVKAERERRIYYPAVAAWSLERWIQYNFSPLAILFVGESVGFMLIGLFLYRSGVLTGERPAGVYAALALGGYGLGLAIRGGLALAEWRTGHEAVSYLTVADPLLYEVGRLPTTLGLVGLVVLLFKQGLLAPVAAALKAIGRLALTNYMAQSAITSLLFYGFGLLGRLSFAELMALCAAIWVAQAVFSLAWLARWEMGPLEWLLRSVTYGSFKPLARTAPAAAPAAQPAE